MSVAVKIRSFVTELFGNRYIQQLRDDLDEARTQRDYFKGRAERLELLLTQPRVANRDLSDNPTAPRVHGIVGGRKTWAQLVAERRRDLAEKSRKANGSAVEVGKPNSANSAPE